MNSQAGTDKKEIEIPTERGNIKFSQGAGFTPQQRKDFEEKRQRKLQEEVERRKAEQENKENTE